VLDVAEVRLGNRGEGLAEERLRLLVTALGRAHLGE
jgi:hypothetical protein